MSKCTCPEGGPGKVWGLHHKTCPIYIKKKSGASSRPPYKSEGTK